MDKLHIFRPLWDVALVCNILEIIYNILIINKNVTSINFFKLGNVHASLGVLAFI